MHQRVIGHPKRRRNHRARRRVWRLLGKVGVDVNFGYARIGVCPSWREKSAEHRRFGTLDAKQTAGHIWRISPFAADGNILRRFRDIDLVGHAPVHSARRRTSAGKVGAPHRRICIAGHRIGILQIVAQIAHGRWPEKFDVIQNVAVIQNEGLKTVRGIEFKIRERRQARNIGVHDFRCKARTNDIAILIQIDRGFMHEWINITTGDKRRRIGRALARRF